MTQLATSLGSKIDAPLNVVSSYNEWDLLEEVVIGRLEKSVYPPQHISILGALPQSEYNLLFWFGGRKVSKKWAIEPAQKELDELIHILEAEGVKVRQPDIIDHNKKYSTPNWSSKGTGTACPRDCFIVVGNEIIETPMAWRCRYFERHAYYSLFKEYFAQGAKWTSAPKPPLLDTLYDKNYKIPQDGEEMHYVINESEIVFDAADFIRCGRDIFVTRSNVTNEAGIRWLQNHLGDEYRIHKVETRNKQPIHIDNTFMPLAPGKLMINPKYIDAVKIPAIFKSWDILVCPDPVIIDKGFFSQTASMCGMWLNMNVLMLDEERVICERSQDTTMKALKDWGFKPIPCDLLNFIPFGGAFHCATLDVRRRGTLQSYF